MNFRGGLIRLKELEEFSKRDKTFLGEYLGETIASRKFAPYRDSSALPENAQLCVSQVIKVDVLLAHAKKQKAHLEDGELRDWFYTITIHNHELANIVHYYRSRMDFAFYVGCRDFVERWSFNRAEGSAMKKESKETQADFIDRIWGQVKLPNGSSIGQWWSEVSNIIHGIKQDPSGADNTVQALPGGDSERMVNEYARMKIGFPKTRETEAVMDLCFRTVLLVCPQFLASAALLVNDLGDLERQFIFGVPKIVSTESNPWPSLRHIVHPTDVVSHRVIDKEVENFVAYYENNILSKKSYDVIVNVSFDVDIVSSLIHHRQKDLERGLKNYEIEKKVVEDSSFEYFISSIFRYSTIAEFSIIVGKDIGREAGTSLMLAGYALNSAWRVWLDDSDLSIAICRTVLEQVARARAFRTKPEKAKKQSLMRYQAPSRWIELASLKRLSKLNGALGEFCHYRNVDGRHNAREKLIRAQGDSAYDPRYTARTNLLLNTAYAVAIEISEILTVRRKRLASGFEDQISLVTLEEKRNGFERFLQDSFNLDKNDGIFDRLS